MQKPPPVYDVDFVLHPEEDNGHVFFEHAAENPFQGNPPAVVPRVNAWWLAEAALASYRDAADMAAICTTAGLECESVTAGSTEAYVAYAADHVIVAFRGTQSDQWGDIVSDVEIALVPWPNGGLVHRGFRHALDAIWPALLDTLNRCQPAAPSGSPAMASAAPRDAGGGSLSDHARRLFVRLPADRRSGVCRRHDHEVRHADAALREQSRYRHPRAAAAVRLRAHRSAPADRRDGTISNHSSSLQHFFSTLIGAPDQLLPLIEGWMKGVVVHPGISSRSHAEGLRHLDLERSRRAPLSRMNWPV
jgi:hypothetical protein